MKGWVKGLGAAVLVAGVGLWASADWLKLHAPGLLAGPIAPNRPVVWAAGPEAAPAAARPANIILIVADDLGWNDISLTGEGVAGTATPNIDRVGLEGVQFDNGYAGNATCAPSRAALLSGRYATRFGYEFTPTDTRLPDWFPTGLFRPDAMFARNIAHADGDWDQKPVFNEAEAAKAAPPGDKGMPSSEITIAEQLQGRGYHTIHLGKWHLGEARGMRPEDQGFDESLGFIIGGQLFLPENDPNVVNSRQDFDPIDKFLWANLPFSVQYNGGPRFAPDRYMTDYLTEQALAGIRANRNRPFFMYLAYNAPHTPLQALKADYDALSEIKDHRLRVYAAMVRALDRGVGRVLDELKRQGLDENTLVVFTSDNGGAHYVGLPDLNKPYRGWKATFYEGGTKVPFMMRWPGRIAPATRVAAPVSHFDIYATASAVAGAALPDDRPVDGVDLLPHVLGTATGRPHETLFWRSGDYRVVRHGDWKLQTLLDPAEPLLFDLAADPTERRNLAAARPDKLAELQGLLAAHDARQKKPGWASLVRAPIAIDRPLGTLPVKGEDYVYWSN
ncbi:arylsulfatase A-like enzyme [Polymorphobacter multimanifer]|uniref:Arylsulfatase A-like enzyme n=1 Tax=Polymorphobacter multimanifer TaxID=1070431 RepID=A0A841LGY7_9SPHN|nr:sulfatase-like hydrolase/transferase [Polymorphobacter multimanifer]MBB6228462.1 arylsulfatase A-like enzyme [Polymorphobacter multimanifer]